MTERYDVIVAGSGPAGGTAAYFLGQAGKKVLLLEKESLPRYKTCGGAVSLNFLKIFPFSFEPVVRSKVEAITYAVGEKMVTVPIGRSRLSMVMRDEFDEFLARHARAALHEGAEVTGVEEQEEGVTVTTAAGERYETEYLVGADGAKSAVARLAGLRRKKVTAGAIEIEAKVPEQTLRRYEGKPLLIFGEVSNGYVWIFPKADHVSVGVGGLNPRPGELQGALERSMGRFGISIDGQQRHGHPVPFYTAPEKVNTGRILLAGDAAGTVDPLTGEGIRFAIKSGKLAAEAILSGRVDRYAARLERAIGGNHRLATLVGDIFFSRTAPLFELVMRNPVMTRALGQMVDDRIGYGRFLLAITSTLPLHLLRKRTIVERTGEATLAREN